VRFISDDAVNLADLTDLDNKFVAVVWRVEDDKGPELVLGGLTEFEAVGLMRAALKRLEAYTESTMNVPADIDLELEEDGADDA